MEALNNMVETKLDNGNKRIEIAFADLLKAVLVTDENNIPKRLEVETTSFNGYKLFVNIDLEFNDEINILNPENKNNNIVYFNLSTYKNVIKNIINLRSIKSNLNLSINNKQISFDVLANLQNKDFNLKLKDNDFGYVNNLSIIFKDNNAYLTVDQINLLFSDKFIDKAIEVFAGFVNLDNKFRHFTGSE